MLARALAVELCLCVHMSVTRRYRIEMAAWIELIFDLVASLNLFYTVF